jgi:CheY-like chemotaxis protein
MPNKRILIVDDDGDIRDSLREALVDEEYEVALASDGREAIEYLRSNQPPNLILLDWMMPNCDGACFRKLQRQDEELAKIPVVLLTADTRIEKRMAEIEVTDCVPKPVRLRQLLEVIERHAA